ncbi:MAG: hypothetical protein DME57_06900 [Verrucomicrobia bacterium]|nr:MAG: hypothetical protein DME57_06900 [Verrucomicrobiota bacterium]
MIEKLRAAFERMNRRVLWRMLLSSISSSRAQLAMRKTTRNEQNVYMRERELWKKRDEWLEKTQPAMKGAEEASTLLEQLKQVAGKYNIGIENPSIGPGDATPQHQAVFASIETSSHWPELVHFLYDVQQPDAFVVFESVNLAIDNSDQTLMRGKLKIAKWFAPAQRKKS